MKRSEINALIRENETFFESYQFKLPPFAAWTPEDWQSKGKECDEIRNHMLGWDATDFGLGDYKKYGLFLFTLRNGNPERNGTTKPYAEKIMVSCEGQICPMHFHWHKQEDIINRGGGVLCMALYLAAPNDELDHDSSVEIVCDGVKRAFPAGTVLELLPGESCTLTRRVFHSFWAKPGFGKCLVGEVSECNDDATDNHFLDCPGRFPSIDEDEKPYRFLCNEYPHHNMHGE